MAERLFGTLTSGEPVLAFTLASRSGVSVDILTYGGTVSALRVPDRRGEFADVVLGFDTLEGYVASGAYCGAIVGRIAGRVSPPSVKVGERSHPLSVNRGAVHLHGGQRGLNRRVWKGRALRHPDGTEAVRLTYRSPDGEEGYPGTVDFAVTYTLSHQDALIVDSEATADQPTPVCLTHHSYFNLAGAGTVADHEIQILADAIVPTDESLILSGHRTPVAQVAGNFARPRRLGDALPFLAGRHGDFYHLRPPGAPPPPAPTLAACVVHPASGRRLQVSTDEACLQFYTGVGFDGTTPGKRAVPIRPFAGLCLECQGYPGPGNAATFGDIVVAAGETRRRRTIYAFSTS